MTRYESERERILRAAVRRADRIVESDDFIRWPKPKQDRAMRCSIALYEKYLDEKLGVVQA